MIPIRGRGRRVAAHLMDAGLGVVAPLITRPRASSVPRAPRVLIIRCDHIGDAVMATSVLRPLHDALEPSTLDVLAGPWAAPVFAGHPAVTRVVEYATPWWSAARGASRADVRRAWRELPAVVRRIRQAKYDIGIDLRGDLRHITFFLALGGIPIRVSSDRTGGTRLLTDVWRHDATLHEVEKDFAVAGMLGVVGTPRLDVCIDPTASLRLEDVLSPTVKAGGYAILALRGSERNRAWPIAHAATLVEHVHREFGLAAVFVGAERDAPLGEELARTATSPVINLAGRTSLAETLAVLRNAAVAVAVDSGPMHLAAAAGTPVVALFGSGDPRESRPWTNRAEVTSTGAPCGCLNPSCDFVDGPGRCMRELSPDVVLAAVRRAVALRQDENVLRDRAASGLVDGKSEQ